MLNQSSRISSNKEVDRKDVEQLTSVQQSTAITNVEYPIPLSSDCTTMEHKEKLPIIPHIEKDSPMQDLHEIISHQLHEVNIIEIKESRVDGMEDKDEHNNNINSLREILSKGRELKGTSDLVVEEVFIEYEFMVFVRLVNA
ncbi:hypothetical protein H5410_015087 [Solanum commersonii]|uniref:Uncharacterized protein n=1 Tax=Solanum commersonii TaxID=4109 RepID=A0A9J5ZTE5_SOLCO|nr:hypothetical protein H5410_015087 [Solanum commersonii]